MENDGLTDSQLRELYLRAFAKGRGGRGRTNCVAPEAMVAMLRREGPEFERLEMLDHVMACGACRPEFELLRSIEQAGSEADRPKVVSLLPRRGRRAIATFALAASVLLVVVVGQKMGSREEPDVVRGSADGVALLAPGIEVDSGSPVSFSWQPVPGARQYEMEVLDERGRVVASMVTEGTSAILPSAIHLLPGSTYRWWVRATTGAGDQRASPLRPLRIRSK